MASLNNKTQRTEMTMPRKTPAKARPQDVFNAEQIARAVYFTAHFRVGPNEKYTIKCMTLDEARTAAANLNTAHGGYGRRACVYAVTPEGMTFHV
jgi:hypothetical protein